MGVLERGLMRRVWQLELGASFAERRWSGGRRLRLR